MAKFFSLSKNLNKTFNNYFNESDFCVTGIGSECCKTCEYVLSSHDRIDMLQLFLPQDAKGIKIIKSRGINIEIYIFANAQIYDKNGILEEFKQNALVYTIKEWK